MNQLEIIHTQYLNTEKYVSKHSMKSFMLLTGYME